MILRNSVRCLDPFVHCKTGWVVRRLAPDCSRIELAHLPQERDETRLLEAMGAEMGNIHLGSRNSISAVRRHLCKLPPKWLHLASQKMTKAIRSDWIEWRAHWERSGGKRVSASDPSIRSTATHPPELST